MSSYIDSHLFSPLPSSWEDDKRRGKPLKQKSGIVKYCNAK